MSHVRHSKKNVIVIVIAVVIFIPGSEACLFCHTQYPTSTHTPWSSPNALSTLSTSCLV